MFYGLPTKAKGIETNIDYSLIADMSSIDPAPVFVAINIG